MWKAQIENSMEQFSNEEYNNLLELLNLCKFFKEQKLDLI